MTAMSCNALLQDGVPSGGPQRYQEILEEMFSVLREPQYE